MNRSFLLAPALAAAIFANAQQTVHQVMVLNEGRYDYMAGEQAVPVTLGSYDPTAGTYQTVATIANARFSTQVLVDNGTVYVAADSFLLKYDADSYELLGQAVVKGIRHFAVWNDEVICTKGDYLPLDNFIEVLDKNTLEPVYTIPTTEMPYTCDGIEVWGDKAYIAVNNGFDFDALVGKVGVLDLVSGTLSQTIDLGPDGQDPERIMLQGDQLYTFNNKDFNTSSISKLSIANGQQDLVYTNNVTQNSSCGSSVLSADHIYFLEYSVGHLARYDLGTDAVADTLQSSPMAYGLLDDPIDQVIYATTTDYVSSGDLYVMGPDGTILHTVPVGVSAGSLALDVRSETGVRENSASGMLLYPDPAATELFVRIPGAAANSRVQVLDSTGRILIDQVRDLATTQRLDISDLVSGTYLLRVDGGRATRFTVR